MQQGHEFIYLAKKLRDAQTERDETFRSKKHQTKLKKIEAEFDEYLKILLDPEKFKKRFA
jgi:hypothetical protein